MMAGHAHTRGHTGTYRRASIYDFIQLARGVSAPLMRFALSCELNPSVSHRADAWRKRDGLFMRCLIDILFLKDHIRRVST